MNTIKINLGSGRFNLPGFINVDIVKDSDRNPDIRADALQYLARLPADSVSEIYAGHFIEHLSEMKCHQLIEECHRVLIEGGKLIVTVPDSDKAVDAMSRGVLSKETVKGCIFGTMENAFEYHKQVFSSRILQERFSNNGWSGFRFLDACEYRPADVIWQTTIELTK